MLGSPRQRLPRSLRTTFFAVGKPLFHAEYHIENGTSTLCTSSSSCWAKLRLNSLIRR